MEKILTPLHPDPLITIPPRPRGTLETSRESEIVQTGSDLSRTTLGSASINEVKK